MKLHKTEIFLGNIKEILWNSFQISVSLVLILCKLINMKVRESLLKETGNISPHRVSEETRKKGMKRDSIQEMVSRCLVFDESEGIRNKMIEHYINSRQKFKQDEYERHRVSTNCQLFYIMSTILYYL